MTPGSNEALPADRALARLPESIRIGGFDFGIVRIPPMKAVSENRFGAFSGLEQTIEIQYGVQSVHKLVDTFFHEISHAFYWVYGVGKDDSEERTVSMLGRAFMALHRDNTWIAPWIEETLRSTR